MMENMPAQQGAGQMPPEMPAEGTEQPEMMAEGGEQRASPEEQALYNKFVAKAYMLTYDDKMLPKVVEMLKGGGDPIQGLATTAATIVARVAHAADQGGQKLPGDVLLHAGKEIFEDLADLSKTAGIKDFSQDEDALEGALFRAMDEFRMLLQGAGRLNQQAAAADLAKLEEMDKAGELEKMLSGLAAEDAQARKAPAAGEDEEPQPKSRGLMRQEMN